MANLRKTPKLMATLRPINLNLSIPMAKILLFSFFLSCWFSGFAQAPVKGGILISGVVKDSLGGEPLEKASISLKGPRRYTVLTDAKGAFAITGVPAGNYSVAIAFVGYTPLRQPVLVVEKDNIDL